jgi:hypothetical protein
MTIWSTSTGAGPPFVKVISAVAVMSRGPYSEASDAAELHQPGAARRDDLQSGGETPDRGGCEADGGVDGGARRQRDGRWTRQCEARIACEHEVGGLRGSADCGEVDHEIGVAAESHGAEVQHLWAHLDLRAQPPERSVERHPVETVLATREPFGRLEIVLPEAHDRIVGGAQVTVGADPHQQVETAPPIHDLRGALVARGVVGRQQVAGLVGGDAADSFGDQLQASAHGVVAGGERGPLVE